MSGDIREQGTVIAALGGQGLGWKRIAAEMEVGVVPPDALFQAVTVPSRTVGRKALNELLSAGRVQRIGGGFWVRRRP
jgi:hypothetical protein